MDGWDVVKILEVANLDPHPTDPPDAIVVQCQGRAVLNLAHIVFTPVDSIRA